MQVLELMVEVRRALNPFSAGLFESRKSLIVHCVGAPLGAINQRLTAPKNRSVQWFEVAPSNGL
jgi:hypothetical protein